MEEPVRRGRAHRGPRASVATVPGLLLVLASTLLSSGCVSNPSHPATPGNAGVWRDVRVEGRGREAGGDFCEDFALTTAQAGWLLQHTRVVTASELHDRFELLPCWVHGTVVRDGGLTWRWEARAGGTVRLISPSGDVEWRACQRCDAVLSGPRR